MDRTVVYPSAIPLDVDILKPQQDAMIAIGYALQAHTGQNTVFVGLTCSPTAPASMGVTVGPGAVIAPNVVETTPFGSIAADTTDPLIKMGINILSSSFTVTAPTSSGQSQNYLIEGAFSEADDTPATLIYFNSLNPSQPYSGPSNSGTPQNTRRAQRVNLLLKVGVPANTGSQITPPVDAGWSGLYVITVNYGQTAVTATSITTYPNAPFLSAFLSSHHGGTAGQAPRINLASEVQGILPQANLPSGVGANLTYAGNPNGFVAGNASTSSSPPTMCWDSTDDEWWTCITSGTASTTVWACVNNSKNVATYFTAGTFTWTPPAGVTKVKVTVVGAGGGGGGSTVTGSTTVSCAPGGNGGTVAIGYYTVSAAVSVVVGSGGIGGSAGGGAGTNGGTSSFGTFASAPGGHGGGGVPAAVPPVVYFPPSASNIATGGTLVNGGETSAQGGISGSNAGNAYGGAGGAGHWGGSGAAAVGVGANGTAPGAGGSGSGIDASSSGTNGGYGSNGCVIIEW